MRKKGKAVILCYNLREILASYKALQNLVLQNLISYNMLFKYLITCKILYRDLGRLTDEIALALVYDCGSCLFPQADEEIMKKVLEEIEVYLSAFFFPEANFWSA